MGTTGASGNSASASAGIEDKAFYVNLEVLRKRLLSQDNGMIAGISVTAVAVLVGGILVIVSKSGKLELGLLTFGLVICMVSVLILHLDAKSQLRGIDDRVARYRTQYYDDINNVQCPLHFTKAFNYATNVFECLNTNRIKHPANASQELPKVEAGKHRGASPEASIYPYPFYAAGATPA